MKLLLKDIAVHSATRSSVLIQVVASYLTSVF